MSGNKYNKKSRNYYLKVLAVQDTYQSHKKEGISSRYVYRVYIRQVYFISERTLYHYLTINAKKALSNIDQEAQ